MGGHSTWGSFMSPSQPLLAIMPCPAVPEAAMDGPGFAWWYVDLVDDAGNGVVVIGAFGLPFLPGLASADRRGDPTPAHRRPSLNVAVYRNHQRLAYVLQEYPAEDCAWQQGQQRFGRSWVRSVVENGQCAVDITLDLDIPGSPHRLTGHVRGQGAVPQHAAAEQGPHGWTVLASGPGDVDVRMGEQTLLRTAGRMYHDSNWSLLPLHRLNIGHWIWARIPRGEGDLVVWMLQSDDRATVLHRVYQADAAMTPLDGAVECRGSQRGAFGMVAPASVVVTVGEERHELVLRRCVDDGFFYQRWLVDAGDTHGTCEIILPHQIDRAQHRPLVRMAHHRIGQPNSMWLPLFNGPMADRWSRLLRWWRSGCR